MDEGLPSASFLLLAAVLIADIFVFGFDAAITRVKEEDVENKSRENKNKVASGLLKIMENPEKHIRAMNVFAAAVNMVLGGIVTKVSEDILHIFWILAELMLQPALHIA